MPLYILNFGGAENTLERSVYSNRTVTQILQKNYQMFERSIVHGCSFVMNLCVSRPPSKLFSYSY